MRALSAVTALMVALAIASPGALPHSGGLDASGCHTNRKTGEYHCHRKPSAPTGVVKKSKSGICHAPSSPWYEQTIHYTAFETVESCLQSGGRLPKG